MFLATLTAKLRLIILNEQEFTELKVAPDNVPMRTMHGNPLYIVTHIDGQDLCEYAKERLQWRTYDYAIPQWYFDDYHKRNGAPPVGVWVYHSDNTEGFVSKVEMMTMLWTEIAKHIVTGQAVYQTKQEYLDGRKQARMAA